MSERRSTEDDASEEECVSVKSYLRGTDIIKITCHEKVLCSFKENSECTYAGNNAS
jgi:hypothetical protein